MVTPSLGPFPPSVAPNAFLVLLTPCLPSTSYPSVPFMTVHRHRPLKSKLTLMRIKLTPPQKKKYIYIYMVKNNEAGGIQTQLSVSLYKETYKPLHTSLSNHTLSDQIPFSIVLLQQLSLPLVGMT